LGWPRFPWYYERGRARPGRGLAMSLGMPGNRNWGWWCDRAPVAALLSLAFLASGCGGSSGLFGGPAPTASAPASSAPAPTAAPASGPQAAPAPSTGQRLKDDISNFFSGSSANAPQAVAGATPDVDCPYIEIREGASTLTVNAGTDNSAMSLKYQGTFVRGARQCAVVAGQMVMKVGVEGRIILGPAGGPGEVNVPLRIAVVDRAVAGSKTIITKLIVIPVTVESANANPTFTHVEDNVTFPMPPGGEIDNYIVYIGFDPLATQPQEKPAKPKPKRRPRVNPAAAPAPGTD
jgi:hypothetical protein